jgi:hypothetical protein
MSLKEMMNFYFLGDKYVCRTQAGFRNAWKDFLSKEDMNPLEVMWDDHDNFPNAYPVVVRFSLVYRGNNYLQANWTSLSNYLEKLKEEIVKIESRDEFYKEKS